MPLLLLGATAAAANNASFQYLFPRGLLLVEVPVLLFLLHVARRDPAARLFRGFLGLVVALTLLGWVTGEALWAWESADLSLRWSRFERETYCKNLMTTLRALEHLQPGIRAELLPVSGDTEDRRIGSEILNRIRELDALERHGGSEFSGFRSRSLMGRPGRLSVAVAHTRCPAGGDYRWDAASAGVECSLHGKEAELRPAHGSWDDALPELETALLVAHSAWPMTLPAWLILGIWGLGKALRRAPAPEEDRSAAA